MINLRPYQDEAINHLKEAISGGVKSPLVCLPTGSGKTPVLCAYIAGLAAQHKGERFLVCVHTQELIKQIAGTYKAMTGDTPGVFSASIGKRQMAQVTIAQTQTFFRAKERLDRFHTLVIDECDRVPTKGTGQYRSLIQDLKICNPNIIVVGLTATPYRMGSGLCYGPGQMFEKLVYDAPIKVLMDQGYLCKLVGKNGGAPDLSEVHIRNGDYVAGELEDLMADESKVSAACDEILRFGADRKKWLIFACGVKHAHMVSEALARRNIICPTIVGNTEKEARNSLVASLRSGDIRGLVNVNVLSVGFDAPDLDLIVLLRPTKSPGLYYQQIGRGLRVHPNKQNTMVLDMAGNIAEHGPIDLLNSRVIKNKSAKSRDGVSPTRTCPGCSSILHISAVECGDCGYQFPKEIVKHDTVADDLSPISDTTGWYWVKDVHYSLHSKMDQEGLIKYSIRIDYILDGGPKVTEFVGLGEKARSNRLRFVAKAEDKSKPVRITTSGNQLATTDNTKLNYSNIAYWFTTLKKPFIILPEKNGKYYQIKGRSYDFAEAARILGLPPSPLPQQAGHTSEATNNELAERASTESGESGRVAG